MKKPTLFGDRRSGNCYKPALMLAIAYGASVGGIGTPIGTPPNIEFAGQFEQRFPDALNAALCYIAIATVALSFFAIASGAEPEAESAAAPRHGESSTATQQGFGDLGEGPYDRLVIRGAMVIPGHGGPLPTVPGSGCGGTSRCSPPPGSGTT